jgi:hypothetical protein
MREQGPFDKLLQPDVPRDRTAIFIVGVIVVLAVVLLILVLPPVSILKGGGGAAPTGPGALTSRPRSKTPEPPAGWEILSPLYELEATNESEGGALLTVKLDVRPADERNLALYTYEDGQWKRLAPATLTSEGTAAQGEVSSLPQNVAVLRRSTLAVQVAGWLPLEAETDPEAARTLSVLHPVDFVPAADGILLGTGRPRPEDSALRVLPTVRALGPPDSEAVDTVLASPELRQAHIDDILRVVREGTYDGINIDYRVVSPARGADFTQFVVDLADALHREGDSLTLTLPLPVREAAGWDTGAYDWQALGEAVDAIEVVPESDQSLYYQRMEDALEFLTQQVDRSKLMLVVSPFSHEKGGEGIKALLLSQALGLASTLVARTEGDIRPQDQVTIVGSNIYQEEGASGLFWDDEALAVSFSYPGEGGARTVWIENGFSIAFKLDLVRRFQLGGVAVDDVSLSAAGPNIWGAIQELAESGEVTLVKPNGSLLKPYWEASEGALDGGATGAVVWTAPAAGTYEVTLVVSDGVVRVGQRLSLEVKAGE